jgi:hypothetical protein
MTRWFYVALALVLSVLFAVCQKGMAAGVETEVSSSMTDELLNIPEGDYRAYFVHLDRADEMNLSVRVALGGEIDVYTMSMSDYTEYKGGAKLVSYYSQYSKENLKFFIFAEPFQPSSNGDYVVVIDNTNSTLTGATAAGEIACEVKIDLSHQAKTSSGSSKGFLPGFEAMVLVASLAALLYIKKYSSN